MNNNNAINSNGVVPDCTITASNKVDIFVEISAQVQGIIIPSCREYRQNLSTLTQLSSNGDSAAIRDDIFMTIKEEVCSFHNLYKAMNKCKRGVMWKDSVVKYTYNRVRNVYQLAKSLELSTYTIDKYILFKVYEPKERDIVSTRLKDRIFQRSLCDSYLYNRMTKSFIYDNCACQVGKGTEFARKRLIRHMQKYYRQYGSEGWVLKTDISNFFGSISHDKAMAIASKLISDDWVLSEIKRLIDSYGEVGLGLGSEITQLLALSILNSVDHKIKERLMIKYYVRYNDDCVIIAPHKSDLRFCLSFIKNCYVELGLKLNVKKTKIFSLSQGVKFLGFRFRLLDTGKVLMTILKTNVAHEKRKLKRQVNRFRNGEISYSNLQQCYTSWRAHISNDSKKKRTRPGKRAHRNNNTVLRYMDQYYKNLLQEA